MNLTTFLNGTVINAVAKYVLGIIAASLVAKGTISADQATDISGYVLGLIGIIWQVIGAGDHATVKAAVANSGVKVVGTGKTAVLTPSITTQSNLR